MSSSPVEEAGSATPKRLHEDIQLDTHTTPAQSETATGTPPTKKIRPSEEGHDVVSEGGESGSGQHEEEGRAEERRVEHQPPALTHAMVMLLLSADPARRDRASGVYNCGSVSRCKREGCKLEARVEGEHRPYYRVRINLKPVEPGQPFATDLDQLRRQVIGGWTCTCPDWGNPCKHIGAVLFTWAASPGDFRRRRPLAEVLAPLTREELLDLVLSLADNDPSVSATIRATVGQRRSAIDVQENVITINSDEDNDDEDEEDEDDDDDDEDDGRWGYRRGYRRGYY